MLIRIKISSNLAFLGSHKPRMLFFPLINVKMPTIVGIFTFMSRKNFMLSLVEHETSFITLGPGVCLCCLQMHNAHQIFACRRSLARSKKVNEIGIIPIPIDWLVGLLFWV